MLFHYWIKITDPHLPISKHYDLLYTFKNELNKLQRVVCQLNDEWNKSDLCHCRAVRHANMPVRFWFVWLLGFFFILHFKLKTNCRPQMYTNFLSTGLHLHTYNLFLLQLLGFFFPTCTTKSVSTNWHSCISNVRSQAFSSSGLSI